MRVGVWRSAGWALLVGAVGMSVPGAQTDRMMKLYVTNSLGDNITVIDLKTLRVVGDGVYVYDVARRKLSDKIATGKAPNWLIFSPDGKYCCVSNAGSDDCSIIDTGSRREVARLKVGNMPKRLVVASAPVAASAM